MADQVNQTRPRLLLLDGHSLAYRAFFALPVDNFATTTGQHTNAVFGFTSMLTNVLRDEQPTHVAVAFDLSRQTFRLAEYSEYKAKRNKTPDEFKSQLPLIQRMLDTWNIAYLTAEGFEADDIIATLTTEGLAAGMDVLILTGDRDSLQLVTKHSTVLYPMRGVSDLARMTPEAVEEKYGVPPHRYPEIAALVGEDSDNLPGVPGVGPKTAAKWIATWDGLDNIITNVDKITGKAGDSLREHLGDVMRNRHLNALIRDLPLEKTPAELIRAEWDRQAALEFLDEMEFRGELRTRILDVVATGDEPAEEAATFTIDGRTLAPGEVADFLNELSAEPVAVHVRGGWGSGTGHVDGLAFVTESMAAYVDTTALTPADETALAAWLAEEAKPKLMHDAKGPVLALWGQGEWTLGGLATDTALAAYLVAPDQRSYDLADLTMRYLKRELKADAVADQGALFDDPADDAAQAAMLHARAVLDLAAVLSGALETAGGTQLLHDLEQPLVGLLARMERTGIAVDQEYLVELESFFAGEVRAAAQAAYDVIGKEVNLGSPKQLQVVLFDDLDMPKTKKTKTGYTTDADALQWLFEATEHPFMLHLLRHREAQKLRVTIEGLLKTVQPDGRIHTTFNQTIAATGRLSSTEPNLQNIPVRTEEGRRIRAGFVVGSHGGEAFESLMTADYSQIEMRIMAHLSGDEHLIEAFRSGQDFHTITARRVFGVPDDVAVSSEQRAKIKAMNYGLAYGLSAFGLSQQLKITPGEAQGLMDDYFLTFGGIRDYLEGVKEEARRSGYTETIMGRRRFLPDLTSDNRQRREAAERMALNAPIQGSAADLIKVAMLNTQAAMDAAGLRSRLLLQVHDELVLEVAAGEREVLENLVRREMGAAAALRVPLDVSVGTGRSWHDAAH